MTMYTHPKFILGIFSIDDSLSLKSSVACFFSSMSILHYSVHSQDDHIHHHQRQHCQKKLQVMDLTGTIVKPPSLISTKYHF